jgi:ABC-type multidrug transport system permease subunit
MTMRITRTTLNVAGMIALIPGLLFWIVNINLTAFHILFGLIVAIALLIVGIIAVSTRGLRAWGIAAIVYTAILPIFGLTQSGLLVGDLHWLIRSLHLLVGIGAMALASLIGRRYLALKRGNVNSSATSQVVQQGKL